MMQLWDTNRVWNDLPHPTPTPSPTPTPTPRHRPVEDNIDSVKIYMIIPRARCTVTDYEDGRFTQEGGFQ